MSPVKAWIFSRPYFHYCSSSVHYCVDHFHVFMCSSHIWFSYIHSHLFITSWVYMEPAPSWLVSSVGRALPWYCRGHEFKSLTGLYYFHYCSSSVHCCKDHFHIKKLDYHWKTSLSFGLWIEEHLPYSRHWIIVQWYAWKPPFTNLIEWMEISLPLLLFNNSGLKNKEKQKFDNLGKCIFTKLDDDFIKASGENNN